MPQIIDNEDGTKTFSVNSSELRILRNAFIGTVAPDFKKVLKIAESSDLRAVITFLRAVFA
jgi:hypothetical protein